MARVSESGGGTAGQRRTRWGEGRTMLAAAALAALMALAIAPGPAAAQDTRGPTLTLAPNMLVEPGSETAIAIQVGPVEAIPKNSFVRLRGLPAGAFLSEGHAVSPGSWAIPIAGLATLKVSAPPTLQGRSQIDVALVTSEGAVVAQARSALVFAPASLIAPPATPPSGLGAGTAPPPAAASAAPITQSRPPAIPAPAVASPPAVNAPPPPQRAAPAESEEAQKYRQRGEKQLEDGNIVSARLFFQRAVEQGSGAAAMALAQTYDPVELQRIKAVGVQPDRETARRWYEKARDLGVAEAASRLSRLGAR